MGSIYTRGGKLWIAFRDAHGKRRNRSTMLDVGDEAKARKILRDLESHVKAGAEVGLPGEVSVSRYADHWIKGRTVADSANEETRLRLHFLPALGAMPIQDVKPRHLIRWMKGLRDAGKLAPRSLLSIYGTVRVMFKDAVREEIITDSPCVLDRRDLPTMADKNPEWRPTAVYSKAELAEMVSDPRVPPDRRVLYALEGLGALRHGEAAGLRWRHYDPTTAPLGKLAVATSYDTGRTKTERPREMPVHPALAALLDAWRAVGWAAMFGREPGPDDLVVPLEPDPPRKRARANPRAGGGMRNKNDSHKRITTDLAALGLRHRRGHDLRRTMISLARSDGAPRDVLKVCTHNPGASRETIDLYTSYDWPTRCAAVACLKLELAPTGKGGGGGEEVSAPLSAEGVSDGEKPNNVIEIDGWRRRESKGGESLSPASSAPSTPSKVAGLQPRVETQASLDARDCRQRRHSEVVTGVLAVSPRPDPVGDALEAALGHWQVHRDEHELARALARIVARALEK